MFYTKFRVFLAGTDEFNREFIQQSELRHVKGAHIFMLYTIENDKLCVQVCDHFAAGGEQTFIYTIAID